MSLSRWASIPSNMPLTSQARVNIICRPMPRIPARPGLPCPAASFLSRATQTFCKVVLSALSVMWLIESLIQVLNASKFRPLVRCRTVSLARTLVVPSQTLLLAVSRHNRLTLNSGSSGSSVQVSVFESYVRWMETLTHVPNSTHCLLALLEC